MVLRVFFDPLFPRIVAADIRPKKAQALSECENDRAKKMPKPEAHAEEKIFYSAPISAIVNEVAQTPAPRRKTPGID